MARVIKSVTINVPVEKVFNYVVEPTNLVEVWPGLEEVKEVRPLPNGGTAFRFVYKMAGMRFAGATETIEHVPNQRTVGRSTEGITSTVKWLFQSKGTATEVSFEVEYTVPVPLLGKLAEGFIVRANEHEAETILANLKDRMEV